MSISGVTTPPSSGAMSSVAGTEASSSDFLSQLLTSVLPDAGPSSSDAASRQPRAAGSGSPSGSQGGALVSSEPPQDYTRFNQSETLPANVLRAIEKALGVELTGADATYNLVDPGEDPASMKPNLPESTREGILGHSGISYRHSDLTTTAWVNRERSENDARQYGVSNQTGLDYFAAQEATHAYLDAIYDGTNGKPKLAGEDNEVAGEAASSHVSPDMAAARVLDISTGMVSGGGYGKLDAIGVKAVEDTVKKYGLKGEDGTPVDPEEVLNALGEELRNVPYPEAPTVADAFKNFEANYLAKLEGTNGFTPEAFTKDLKAEIVKDLRDETNAIMNALEDGTYAPQGEDAPAAESAALPGDAGNWLQQLLG
jgi:hypothetical protein